MNNSVFLSSILTAVLGFFIFFATEGSETVRSNELTYAEMRRIYTQDPSRWPAPHVDEGISWEELEALPASPFRGVDSLEARTTLGRALFFDPRLSGSNQISCSSCHEPDRSWQDGRVSALGHNHRLGNRNTPSILNIWGVEPVFWDGRAATLEELSLHPIADSLEMNMNLDDLPGKLQQIYGYPALFVAAYNDSAITLDGIAAALAQFQRTVVSRSSDFDRFMRGDTLAMSDSALHGMHLFRTEARCMNCHHGAFFTDKNFHNLGLHFYGREREDLGRYHVTGDPSDMGKFRTPPLRDVAFTSPYTHNGLVPALDGIVNMYNAGMARPRPRPGMEDDPHFPVTSEILVPLGLSNVEKDAIVAFLEAISERPFRIRRPTLLPDSEGF